jgi:hypothetical protein
MQSQITNLQQKLAAAEQLITTLQNSHQAVSQAIVPNQQVMASSSKISSASASSTLSTINPQL